MEIEVEKVKIAVEEFKSLTAAYNSYLEYSETPTREGLAAYETKFVNIYSDVGILKPFFWKLRTLHDDKRATSIKSRLAHKIHEGEKSYGKCETLAYASDAYKNFLDDRADYYEFYETLSELHSAIDARLKEIAHRFFISSSATSIAQ